MSVNTSNRFEPASINSCFSASVILPVELTPLPAFAVAEFNSEPYNEIVPAKAAKSLLSVRRERKACKSNFLFNRWLVFDSVSVYVFYARACV